MNRLLLSKGMVNVIVCRSERRRRGEKRRENYNQFIDRLDINSDVLSFCSNGKENKKSIFVVPRKSSHNNFFLLDLGPTIPVFPYPCAAQVVILASSHLARRAFC